MTHTVNLINQQKGFTLVEMAIVLMIVGLLLGGMLVPLSAQMGQRNVTDTRKQLDDIQQALIGFAIVNGRLPCPADATTPTGQVNAAGVSAGTEYTTTGSPYTCATNIPASNAAWGVLPWATLGVSETDAWGRRFTYRVTGFFADSIQKNTLSTWTASRAYSTGDCVTPISPNTFYYQAQSVGSSGSSQPSWPTVTGQTVIDNTITWLDMGNTSSQSSFALCSSGNLNVGLTAGNSNVAANVPAVIVSHGKNGLGAYTPAGQQIQPVPAAATDEGDNADSDNNFVSHDFTPTFDDLVVWISPNILLNRMVTAGKLP